MARTVQTARQLPFRIYLQRRTTQAPAISLAIYWDTPDRRDALLDPCIFEHLSREDISAHIQITRFQTEVQAPNQFGWGYADPDMPRAEDRREIGLFFDSIGQERTQEFLCY